MTASILVAAHNSTPESKRRADLICDGRDDQVELLASLQAALTVRDRHDVVPDRAKEVECLGRHSVAWLPGDYHLSDSLVIPDAMDMVIEAEGTALRYAGATGDAVVIQGMNRCRYRFGVIESRSTGAALAIRPTTAMPSLHSDVHFMGLLGQGFKGTGLRLDPAQENICVNRIDGSDIAGFEYGVRVMDPGHTPHPDRPTCKCDTNQYGFAYIRRCMTCIEEGQTGNGIDCSLWTVNVDATEPSSVAIRTAACGNRWTIIMGTWCPENTRALIIGKGAMDNVFQMRPYAYRGNHPAKHPLGFPIENLSGNATNRIE